MKIEQFGDWNPDVHWDYEQIKRIINSQKIKVADTKFTEDMQSCSIVGSGLIPYTVTLCSCDCYDFINRQLPCKHIYFLARKSGYISDLPQVSKVKYKEFDKDTEAQRFVQLYLDNIITGEKMTKIVDAIMKGK